MSTANPIAVTTQDSASPAAPVAAGTLRLWPGVLSVVIQWLIIIIPGVLAPATFTQFMGWFFGPIIGTLGLLIWWLAFSRARWADRWLGLSTFIVAAVVTFFALDPSLRALGGFGLLMYGLPIVNTAWVAWLAVTGGLNWKTRRLGLIAVIFCGMFWLATVRMEGANGAIEAKFCFRWTPTAEDKFLLEHAAAKLPSAPTENPANEPPLALEPGDWPAFRGANRDGRLSGVKINADWAAHPPKQLWKHRVGPGWSSVAVVGSRLFTQEQRGESELVVCYDAGDGAELWTHADAVRFNETMAGPGPRATPTFHDGKLYTQGATGKLNCLDARTGKVIWVRDIAADSGAKLPVWGFSASPLIADGVVGVFAGADGKSVLGYNIANGEPKWSAGVGTLSYCSLQPAKLCGIEQAVIATDRGLTSYAMGSGAVLWNYSWPVPEMNRVVQPAVVGDTDVLIGTGFGMGTRRVHVKHDGDAWSTEEVWKSHAIKPYFNDLVIHHDYLYGFDGNVLTCVKLSDGKSAWRANGYGNGQVLLLADQNLLLVLSEKGEVALVEASPVEYTERGKFAAIEGKTWNHPVIAHGKLFVRNGEEAACYDVSEAAGGK